MSIEFTAKIARHLPSPLTTILGWIVRGTYRSPFPYIIDRKELPYILNARGFVGKGAEVGVKRGCFSESILEEWDGEKLYSIDPWKEFDVDEYQDVANVPQEKHDSFYEETIDRLSPFGKRSQVLRATSKEAAPNFESGELDFVFIDAQHHYEAVRRDIRLWWPKVKPGGLLAGHDYLEDSNAFGEFGVKTAVEEFVSERELRLHTSQRAKYKSWFVFKPQG